MQGGFSFCGVDIARFGLEYAPTLDQTYVFAGSKYDVHQESVDTHPGGYFYGTTIQPKDFILRCFFQDQNISHGVLTTVESFFRPGRTGKLIFQNRDWLWYVATVVDIDISNLLNYRNGFITINLRAYYPFARHDSISIHSGNMLGDHIATNSGLLLEDITPVTDFTDITENTSMLIYNGGSERAGVAIALAGNAGEGVTIRNKTTGQTAKFIAFTPEITDNNGKYIVSDSINGKTVLTDGSTSERSFAYHDYGFIELAPSYPVYRDVHISYAAGSSTISIIGKPLSDDTVGMYINVDGNWLKIIDQTDPSTIIVDGTIDSTNIEYSNIVTMNELEVELGVDASLSKLSFIYKPTFQ